jgi:hypothetical protein
VSVANDSPHLHSNLCALPNGRFVVTISDPRSKNLPVPRGTTAREKLKAYLAAELGEIDP